MAAVADHATEARAARSARGLASFRGSQPPQLASEPAVTGRAPGGWPRAARWRTMRRCPAHCGHRSSRPPSWRPSPPRRPPPTRSSRPIPPRSRSLRSTVLADDVGPGPALVLRGRLRGRQRRQRTRSGDPEQLGVVDPDERLARRRSESDDHPPRVWRRLLAGRAADQRAGRGVPRHRSRGRRRYDLPAGPRHRDRHPYDRARVAGRLPVAELATAACRGCAPTPPRAVPPPARGAASPSRGASSGAGRGRAARPPRPRAPRT